MTTTMASTDTYNTWYFKAFGVYPDVDLGEEEDDGELPAPVTLQETTDKHAEALLDHWADLFQRRYNTRYRAGDLKEKLDAVSYLLHDLCESDDAKAKKAITLLFTHKKLAWLTDMSLLWLTNESNFTRFVVPLLSERTRGKKADWNKPRSKKPVIRIRKRRV